MSMRMEGLRHLQEFFDLVDNGRLEEAMQFLSANGDQLNRYANSLAPFAPLTRAAEEGRLELVRALLVRTDRRGANAALILASTRGHLEIVRELLRVEGVDVNMRGWGGRTALMFAAENGNIEILRELLQIEEIDYTAIDMFGNSTLKLAVMNNHTGAVDTLLSYMSDIEFSNHVNLMYRQDVSPLYGVELSSEMSRRIALLTLSGNSEMFNDIEQTHPAHHEVIKQRIAEMRSYIERKFNLGSIPENENFDKFVSFFIQYEEDVEDLDLFINLLEHLDRLSPEEKASLGIKELALKSLVVTARNAPYILADYQAVSGALGEMVSSTLAEDIVRIQELAEQKYAPTATKISSVYRGYSTRTSMQEYKAELRHQEEEAATAIQSVARGHLARQGVTRMQEGAKQKEELEAARIESKGFVARLRRQVADVRATEDLPHYMQPTKSSTAKQARKDIRPDMAELLAASRNSKADFNATRSSLRRMGVALR